MVAGPVDAWGESGNGRGVDCGNTKHWAQPQYPSPKTDDLYASCFFVCFLHRACMRALHGCPCSFMHA